MQGLHSPHRLRGAAAAAPGRQEDVQGRGGAAATEVRGSRAGRAGPHLPGLLLGALLQEARSQALSPSLEPWGQPRVSLQVEGPRPQPLRLAEGLWRRRQCPLYLAGPRRRSGTGRSWCRSRGKQEGRRRSSKHRAQLSPPGWARGLCLLMSCHRVAGQGQVLSSNAARVLAGRTGRSTLSPGVHSPASPSPGGLCPVLGVAMALVRLR